MIFQILLLITHYSLSLSWLRFLVLFSNDRPSVGRGFGFCQKPDTFDLFTKSTIELQN